MLKAILWDVDGTLAETEQNGHLPAFNQAFSEAGLSWYWTALEYKTLLNVTGGFERITAWATQHAPDEVARDDWRERCLLLHYRKNLVYAERVNQGLVKFRRGVMDWMESARQHGIVQGIVTTTSRFNIEALMQANLGVKWRDYFAVVVAGEDVVRKKPAPDAYQKALQILQLQAHEAVAIEDSPNGLAAAHAADMTCLITVSDYFQDGDFAQAYTQVKQLDELDFKDFLNQFNQ